MTALAIVFWVSAGLVLYAHAGYFLLLGLWIACGPAGPRGPAPGPVELPSVSVIVAAYAEGEVIAEPRSRTCARSTTRPSCSR